MAIEICAVCGKGWAEQVFEMNTHNGMEYKMFYRVCNVCGSEYAGSEEMELNSKARKEVVENAILT